MQPDGWFSQALSHIRIQLTFIKSVSRDMDSLLKVACTKLMVKVVIDYTKIV